MTCEDRMTRYQSSLLNKNVLSLTLKVSTDGALRTPLHSAGAQDGKARPP